MATFEKGILGGFSGKIGNVVGARWRGKDIMRSLPRTSNRIPTEAQLYQREKFKLVSQFLKPIQPILGVYFGTSQGSRSRINLALSYHLKDAVLGTAPPFSIDYSKVMFAKGVLLGFAAFNATHQGNAVNLTWMDNSGQSNAKDNDVVMVLTYNVQSDTFDLRTNEVTRASAAYAVPLQGTPGHEIYVWIAMHVAQSSLVATSSFVGSYTV